MQAGRGHGLPKSRGKNQVPTITSKARGWPKRLNPFRSTESRNPVTLGWGVNGQGVGGGFIWLTREANTESRFEHPTRDGAGCGLWSEF